LFFVLFFFFFVCFVPKLLVCLDCPFLIAHSVFSNVYFIWLSSSTSWPFYYVLLFDIWHWTSVFWLPCDLAQLQKISIWLSKSILVYLIQAIQNSINISLFLISFNNNYYLTNNAR
jgi:hypothetical protein